MRRVTLKKIYQSELRSMRAVEPATLFLDRLALRTFEELVPKEARKPIQHITSQTLRRFKAAWVQQRPDDSPQTFNRRLGTIRVLLKLCVELGYLDFVPQCRKLPEPATEIVTVPEDDLERIYRAASVTTWPRAWGVSPADYWRAIIVVAVNTGLSKCDILGLEWQRIDMKNGVMRVRRQKNRRHPSCGLRAVPINEAVIDHLKAIETENDHVFYHTKSNRQFYQQWHRILRYSGVGEKYTLKNLRSTCGSRVFAVSGITAASEMLHHSSINVTRRHYVAEDCVAENLREASNAIQFP